MENKQRRYLITFFVVFALTCAVLIVTGTRAKLRTERTAMQSRADEFGALVTNWFRETQDSLQILDYELERLEGDPETQWKEIADVLQDLSAWRSELSDAYVCNPEWDHPLVTGDGPQPEAALPEGIARACEGALNEQGGIYITTPYMARRFNVYCVTLSKAIYSRGGDLLAVACIDCYLDKLIGILGHFYSENSYAFLVDGNGYIVNHPYAAYQMRMDRVRNVSEFSYQQAFETSEIRIIRDYDGKWRACLAIPDQNTGFTVVVMEAWQSVYGELLRSLFLSLAALCLGFLLLWFVLRAQNKWQAETTRRLKEAAEEAEKASHAKSAFLANMSHEIRTPIHSVLGMDEMILRESDQPDIIEYASHIQQAGNTLLELINSILDFSKLESEKMELISTAYSLRELVSGLEGMMGLRAKEKNLLFLVHVDEELPLSLIGDEARLRQVLLNLLTNAVKYTQKGQIRFSVSLIEWTGNTARLRFEVSDTGVGIRPENLDRLFLSFERIDEEHNRSIEGTGLGLSIVHRLLELMDTELEVDSAYGIGSTFAFTVVQQTVGKEQIGDYRERRENERKPEASAKTPASLQGRVLAVDDVNMNLLVLKNFLKGTQVEVDTVNGGEQALEKLRENAYDLILLDHMMPHMDGLETLKAIREQHLADGTPCIALTANAISGARQTCLEAGFDGYLSKPVSSQDLFTALEKFLSVRDGQKALSPSEQKKPHESRLTIDAVKEALPEIDIATGVAYCGGTEEFYLPLLEEFATDGRFARLAEYYAADDWENYRVLVHALKSAALMVGLTGLSEQAKDLERAAKELDMPCLRQDHRPMIEHYLNAVERLRPLFETKK